MTLISALKFNPQAAAMVADEQSSDPQRNFKTAQKLQVARALNDEYLIFGGAGPSDLLTSIEQQMRNYSQHEQSSVELLDLLKKTILIEKSDVINTSLLSTYELQRQDLQRGAIRVGQETIPLSPEIKEEARQHIASLERGGLRLGYIAITQQPHETHIYTLDSQHPKPLPSSRPFAVIGSGQDMAEAHLTDYIEAMTREQRANIDEMRGLGELLFGTYKASVRNNGVGGVPMIAFVKQGQLYQPRQNESLTALEVARGRRAGFFSTDFEREALEALVMKNTSYRTVLDSMKSEARRTQSWGEFNEFLRGYK